jgi:hypothetical protein
MAEVLGQRFAAIPSEAGAGRYNTLETSKRMGRRGRFTIGPGIYLEPDVLRRWY